MTPTQPIAAVPFESPVHDCWNRIGVQGDRSCQELVQHIHCRNCPTYSAAASALLERELPARYLDERTAYFAQQKPNTRHDTHSLAIFRIGMEWLALPTSSLVEVTETRPVHTLPHCKGGIVRGLVNIRGELLICVSLGNLLGLEAAGADRKDTRQTASQNVYARLLVIQGEGGRLVFSVDEVHGIHRYHPEQLQQVPSTIGQLAAPYATAMLPLNNRSVGCLDAQLLLYTLQRSLA
jgi:chemotaxis-related protein WspD